MKIKIKKLPLQNILVISVSIILSLITFYLATRESILYENLTYVGNQKSYHHLFVIWGIANSIHYTYCYHLLLKRNQLNHKSYSLICILLTILSILAFLLPFKNHSSDLVSQIHIYGSMFACIGTYILIYQTLILLAKKDGITIHKYFNILTIILSFLFASLFALGDISSFAEIIIINGLHFFFSFFLMTNKKS